MITFKEFLLESQVETKINLSDIDISEYSEAIQNYKEGFKIFKGFQDNKDSIIFSPQNGVRRSAFTSNIYTLIIDNSKDWSKFPKRSKSAICSTNQKDASNFGNVYIVLPKNGTAIAIAPERDFWFSFESLEEVGLDLESFNVALHQLIPNIKDDGYESFINTLKTFDKQMQGSNIKENIKAQKTYAKRLLELLAGRGYKGYDMIDYLEDILSPKENGFHLENSKTAIEGRHEVWFSNDALIIKEEEIQSIL